MPRVSASMKSSRAVMTQSTSRTGGVDRGGCDAEEGCQYVSVSSSREASSFLSKHGIIATCHIRSGVMFKRRLSTVLSMVPVRA